MNTISMWEEVFRGMFVGSLITILITLKVLEIRKPKWGTLEWFGGKFRIEKF